MDAHPTIGGIVFDACQFVAIVSPFNPPEWSVAEIRETPPGYVYPLNCGQSMFLTVYSEPADRANPQREMFTLVGPFNPCDTDFDGMLTLTDLYDPIEFDWNNDGGVSAQDRLDFVARFAVAVSLPRDAGGCP